LIPGTKKKYSTINKKVKEGTFLTENSDKGIVLGVRLAENLNVGIR